MLMSLYAWMLDTYLLWEKHTFTIYFLPAASSLQAFFCFSLVCWRSWGRISCSRPCISLTTQKIRKGITPADGLGREGSKVACHIDVDNCMPPSWPLPPGMHLLCRLPKRKKKKKIINKLCFPPTWWWTHRRMNADEQARSGDLLLPSQRPRPTPMSPSLQFQMQSWCSGNQLPHPHSPTSSPLGQNRDC